MNTKKVLLTLLTVAFIVSIISVSVVNAEYSICDYDNVPAEQVINDIDSTINYNIMQGEIRYDRNHTLYGVIVVPNPVPIGQNVTAIAFTDNLNVARVTFVWVKPFEIVKVETVPVYQEDNLKKANSTCIPDKLGSWWVFVLFWREYTGSCKCKWCFATRWTCFKVVKITQQVPDYPVVGTAGAMTTMFAGLGLFLNKRRKKSA